jgi:hypothetical protein
MKGGSAYRDPVSHTYMDRLHIKYVSVNVWGPFGDACA